jgi:hypothetical protein
MSADALSVDEIAEKLGVTPEAAKKLIIEAADNPKGLKKLLADADRKQPLASVVSIVPRQGSGEAEVLPEAPEEKALRRAQNDAEFRVWLTAREKRRQARRMEREKAWQRAKMHWWFLLAIGWWYALISLLFELPTTRLRRRRLAKRAGYW